MAGQLLLINPRPRRRESASERAKLSRAAKRRPRNALGEFVSGARRNPKAKTNPRRKAVRRYHTERWTARSHPRAADGEFIRKNPRRRAMATRRREPVGLLDGLWDNTLRPAAVGTAGAMVMELGVGYLPLPEELKTGVAGFAVKALIAVGMGLGAKAAGFERAGAELAVGALTVAAATQAKDLAAVHMPDLRLGSMGYFSPAQVEQGSLGMFVEEGIPTIVPARRA